MNKCKLDAKKCKSHQKWNSNRSWCECKYQRKHVSKKDYIWNHTPYTCENDKYLGSIIGDLEITCDKVIEVILVPTNMVPTKTVLTKSIPTKPVPVKIYPTHFNEKKVTCKIENFHNLLAFLLVTLLILIIVSIYCYIIKHQPKKEYFLPYYFITNIMK